VESIVHAGDVGDPSILETLGRIAPVKAVRGNVDRGVLARDLPASAVLEAGGA
jgi:predicted phosphodiesterase